MAGPIYQTARDMRSRSLRAIRGYQKVSTIAALQALTTTSYSDDRPVFVTGLSQTYRWDSTNTDTADGDEIVQPDAGGDGRWLKENRIEGTLGGLPTGGILPVTSLPTTQQTNDTILLEGFRLTYANGLWQGTGCQIETVTGVATRDVVTNQQQHDPTTHTYVDGVAAWVDGNDALLVRKGLVEGFTGLTPGQLQMAGPAGSLATTSVNTSTLTYIGRAVSTTAVYVDVERSYGV